MERREKDASNYGWGCVIHQLSGDLKMGNYWNDEQKDLFISSKEILALVHAIRVLPEEIRNARVDACVDSKVVIGAWEGQGDKTSLQLMRVTKQLFREVSSRNTQLSVESNKNKTDAPSQGLSCTDSKLSVEAFVAVDHAFGAVHHHHHVLFPLREIGPCVLSLQASRSFAQLPASVQPLNPSSPRSLSTVLRHVFSFGLPLLRLPSGVHVKAILVFSFALFLSTCPISFQRLRFICWVISSIFVLNLTSSLVTFIGQ